MENLARATEAIDEDDAYLCGLLRFIGRLAIDQAIHDFGAGVFWEPAESLTAWEQSNVGVTHAEAGGILLRRWRLPEPVALAVEGQDSLESADSPLGLVQALHFAASVLPSGMDQVFFLEATDRPVVVPRQDPFVRANGLSQDAVADLIEQTRTAFARVRDEHYH